MVHTKKQTIEYKRALIYCRVSSERQVNEGHGLDSQEQRCVKRAAELGLEVAEIFPDGGISGGLFERPAMNKLIAYLDEHPKEKFVIIFDDLKRFARNVWVHLQLKTELAFKRQAKLECLNFKFEETSGGRFSELVMAGAAQLEREQNQEQVINKMKARLEAGYWTFCPPTGMTNVSKLLRPVEPHALIYKEAIEKYRDFELNTLEEIRQFIISKYTAHHISRTISLHGVKSILTNLLYCGYLEYEPWGVPRRKAQHEGFISYETFMAVQDRLNNSARPRLRKDYSDDFPLRGFIVCPFHNKAMTAAWYKNKNGKLHPYYVCKVKGCPVRTVQKLKLEGDFLELLQQTSPKPEATKGAQIVLGDLWDSRKKTEGTYQTSFAKELAELETANHNYLRVLIPKATSTELISQYENVVSDNLAKIAKLKQELAKIKFSHDDFKAALGEVVDYLKEPVKHWESPNYKDKRLLLNMYFGQKLSYNKETGFQTPQLPDILELITEIDASKIHLVDMPGNTSNRLFDYLNRFWRFYNSNSAIQKLLENVELATT
jgi:DNA invertase Pin-like site-specific DNA recombinase